MKQTLKMTIKWQYYVEKSLYKQSSINLKEKEESYLKPHAITLVCLSRNSKELSNIIVLMKRSYKINKREKKYIKLEKRLDSPQIQFVSKGNIH